MKKMKKIMIGKLLLFLYYCSVSACSIDGLDPLAINGIDGRMVKMVHQYQSPQNSLWRYSINY
jgi:hypothetical protein